MNNKDAIDVVIIWVDGADSAWQREKLKYSGKEVDPETIDDEIFRYRDWGNLRYLFRGVEKYMPWVRKVHFVTAGHIPDWLNANSEKLNIVNHKDYIPEAYLPTFSSNPIEINIHRIDGLAEKFVFFNDDTFITKPMQISDFFMYGLPREMAVLNRITSDDFTSVFPHILLNDISIINKHFSLKTSIRKHFFKWFTLRYGVGSLLRTLTLLPYSGFSGMSFYHMPSPFLKATFREVWKKEPAVLEATSSHKFRHINDVNQYVMKWWQVASGNFSPINLSKTTRVFSRFPQEASQLNDAIKKQRYKMICINDTQDCKDFEKVRKQVIESFECILPDKSSFEL